MTNLIQPLAIWNGIPSHSITQLLLDFENNLLVSGGQNGQLLLWEISKSEDDQMIFYNIQPKTVLLGHSTEITCITLGSYDWREVIVSISIDGSICVWDVHGLCVASENNVLSIPRPAHAVLLSDNRHIACAGYSPDIEIVDLWSLNVVAPLSGIHQDWINSLYPIKSLEENDGIPMLVSSSIDGEIVIWSLDLSKKQVQYKTPENMKKTSMSSISLKPHSECVPFSSLIIENATPINVEISNNLKTILVICVDKWFLYSAFNPRPLFEVSAPDDKPIIGGSFVNYNRVIIWNKEKAYVYCLPKQDHLQMASFAPPLSPKNEKIEENYKSPKTKISFFKEKPKANNQKKAYKAKSGVLFERRESIFEMPGKEKNYVDEVAEVSFTEPTVVQEFQYLYSSNEESGKEEGLQNTETQRDFKPLLFSAGRSFGGWFGIGTSDSRVALWKIQKTISTEKMTTVLPRTVCILDESWEGVTPTQSKVTDSLVFEDKFLLIRGYENGEITISKLPSNTEKPFSFANSHTKRVNCLWRPAKTSNHRDIFLSTSSDCLIKIWDVEQRTLLYNFCQHTAPVTHILGPPERKATEKRWTNVFFTVGLDKSVGMFSLDNYDCKYLFSGHPDLIDTVRWRVDQDYLVVGSIDGTVSVWDLTTGELEQSIHNQEAENILETCLDLMNVNTLEHRYLNKSIYAHSYHLSPNESPVQIIQLNIQSLLQDLIRTLKRGKESPVPPRMSSLLNIKEVKENKEHNEKVSREELLKTTKAFKIYTYFLPWFESQEQLSSLCESQLLLKPPDPLVSFGFKGENGKLSFLVPRYSRSAEKWQYSSNLTALMCLCSVTLSHAFLDLSTEKNINNQILSYYCTLLPETVDGYVEPSLSFLANFWQDSMLDIKQSARSIFNSTLERVDTKFQIEFSNDFAKQLTSPIKVGSSSRAHAVLVLAILGSQKSESLEDPVKKLVAQELMALLFQQNDKTHQIAAAELLGKGYNTWSKDLPEPSILFQKMFKLCLSKDTNIVGVATSAITSVGVHHPLQFIMALSDDLFKNESSIKEHASALRIIRELVYKNPFCLLPHISKLVHSVVLSLDPSIPNLRDGTIRSTTSLLQTLVKKYPMVSFHQTTQHLALGTAETTILIYNLKSATLWHTLEGHQGPLTAVTFSEDGKFLASYSYQESKVKIWSVTSSFFGLGSSPRCINTQAVPNNIEVKATNITVQTLLEQVQLKWEGPKQVTLIRAWQGSLNLKF